VKTDCPNCGYTITTKVMGRKRVTAPFKNVCETLQWHTRGYWSGQPHFLNTSIEYYRLFGVKISGGTIMNRFKEEAQAKGITYQELVKSLVDREAIKDKQKYIRIKCSEKL